MLSPITREVRREVVGWRGRQSGWRPGRCCASRCTTLPVEVDTDEAGNLWAVLRGERADMLVVGSHLDSVPKGGWLDGALGVMAGLELLRSLAAEGTPPVTVALVDWADEEGARFSRSLFGSRPASARSTSRCCAGLTDKEGNKLPEVLAEHGVDIDNLDGARTRMADVKAYVEVHIEQGPILEAMGLGHLHGHRYQGHRARAVDLPRPGRARGHDADGDAPRQLPRRGPLRARDRRDRRRHDGVTTVGQRQMLARRRHRRRRRDADHDGHAPHRRRRAAGDVRRGDRRRADAAAEAEGCTVEWEHIFRIPPMPFHPRLLDAAREAVREVEGHDVELPSGALHDASEMAREVPTVMIFSSSIAGLSHTKEEDTPDEHLHMAADAFHRTCRRAIELVVAGEL